MGKLQKIFLILLVAISFFFFKTGFHYVGQAGLELPTSGDPPALASKESAWVIGMSQHTQLCACVFIVE